MVNKFCALHLEHSTQLTVGKQFCRARIHSTGQDECWDNKDMSAPPPGIASSGRINPAGISYLYLADNEMTAVSEVRPWKEAKITVATYEINKNLKIADFCDFKGSAPNLEEASSRPPEFQEDLLYSGLITNEYFSTPAHAHDDYAYLASQYIAEKLKNRGLDGIKYKSVLSDRGYNLCLFNPQNATIKTSKIVTVDKVRYEIKP